MFSCLSLSNGLIQLSFSSLEHIQLSFSFKWTIKAFFLFYGAHVQLSLSFKWTSTAFFLLYGAHVQLSFSFKWTTNTAFFLFYGAHVQLSFSFKWTNAAFCLFYGAHTNVFFLSMEHMYSCLSLSNGLTQLSFSSMRIKDTSLTLLTTQVTPDFLP